MSGPHCPLIVVATCQAISLYKNNLAKWAATDCEDKELCKTAVDLGAACDKTALESHLARTFRKEPSQQYASASKYSVLFASVPTGDLHPALAKALKETLAKGETQSMGAMPVKKEEKAGAKSPKKKKT